ncbi:MAG: hypothetical protein JXK04_03035 [Campylobacterales bacterium]|nr:hypothetical protein [Campylobacterales bacterium]
MRVMLKTLRDHFFSAFRELFVYHHTALEFRAKTYAVIIASSDEAAQHYYPVLKELADEVYAESDRARALVITVKEYVSAVQGKKTITEQTLLNDIIQELRLMPRYAQKIEPEHLRKLQSCTHERDSKIYQGRIIDFLSQKRLDFEEIKR